MRDMIVRGSGVVLASLLVAGLVACGGKRPWRPAPDTAAPSTPDVWPRVIPLSNATVLLYEPQVESWDGNQLQFRCHTAIMPGGSQVKTYGVIWGSARTEVDHSNRRVTLEDVTLTHGNFPSLPDNGAAYLTQLQQRLPGAVRTISLDRLQVSLGPSVDFSAGVLLAGSVGTP